MPFRPAQNSFRGRNDTQLLNTNSFTYAKDTNFSVPLDTTFRLRIMLQEVGGVSDSGSAYKLRYAKSGGSYADVTSAGTEVKLALSGQYADKDAITAGYLGGSNSFINGQALESSTATDSLTLTLNNNTELEFSLQLVGTGLLASDYVEFRVYRGSSTQMYQYNITPRVNITQTLSPTGIGSAQALGGPTVTQPGGLTNITAAGAIASLQAFGTAAKLTLKASPSGVATLEAFGTAAKLSLNAKPTGIVSGESFGTAAKLTLAEKPTGIASAAAYGTPSLRLSLKPSGMASLESFGTPGVTAPNLLLQNLNLNIGNTVLRIGG